MIIQDEATSQYGLIDQNGREILPCEYNAMKFLFVNRFNPKTYVAVQSRGSYGVYDTSGQEVVAPLYDDIEGGEYTDTFTVKSHDVYGVVNLEGQEIIPVEYEYIANSAQRMIGALKKEGSDRTLSLYMENGTLQNSFPVEIALSARRSDAAWFSFSNWGTIITLGTESESSGSSEVMRYNLSGNAQNQERGWWGDSLIGDQYFGYLDGTQLSFFRY